MRFFMFDKPLRKEGAAADVAVHLDQ